VKRRSSLLLYGFTVSDRIDLFLIVFDRLSILPPILDRESGRFYNTDNEYFVKEGILWLL